MQTRTLSADVHSNKHTHPHNHRAALKQPPIFRNCQQFDEQRLKQHTHMPPPPPQRRLFEFIVLCSK